MRGARIAALLAAVVAATAAGSCGGAASNPTAPAPGSAGHQVMGSIAAFFGADAGRMCAGLSGSALQRLGGEAHCREAARGREAVAYRVDSVRVDGDSAVAVVRSAGRVIQFTLSEEKGAWRVSEPLPALPGIPSSVPR
jgi:hypothetical protein